MGIVSTFESIVFSFRLWIMCMAIAWVDLFMCLHPPSALRFHLFSLASHLALPNLSKNFPLWELEVFHFIAPSVGIGFCLCHCFLGFYIVWFLYVLSDILFPESLVFNFTWILEFRFICSNCMLRPPIFICYFIC